MGEDLDIVGVDTAEGKDFTMLHLIEYKNGEIYEIVSYRM